MSANYLQGSAGEICESSAEVPGSILTVNIYHTYIYIFTNIKYTQENWIP